MIKSKAQVPEWAVHPGKEYLNDILPGKKAIEAAGLPYVDYRDEEAREEAGYMAAAQNVNLRDDVVLGTFKLGDMQEHRYAGQNNWVKGAVPHEVHWREENPGIYVNERFDPEKKRFLSDWELLHKQQ